MSEIRIIVYGFILVVIAVALIGLVGPYIAQLPR